VTAAEAALIAAGARGAGEDATVARSVSEQGRGDATGTRSASEQGRADAPRAAAGYAFLTSRSLWLISLSQFFTNVGWVFLMTWAPRYFQSVHHTPVEQRALLVSIPPLVGWFGTVLGGVWTDSLMRSVGLRWSRALPVGLSRLLAGFAYLLCLLHPSPWAAVAIFSVVAFATDWSQGTVWAYCQDVGGRYVASVLGWANMWGNLGAALTPPLLIWIVGENQNWPGAFLACAAAFLLAGCMGLAIDARLPVVRGKL
jgi:nitrate/nitrite transporter NarK